MVRVALLGAVLFAAGASPAAQSATSRTLIVAAASDLQAAMPELVELGCMIGLTLGQQSWLRLLNIDHHQVMPGSDASMAPGHELAAR